MVQYDAYIVNQNFAVSKHVNITSRLALLVLLVFTFSFFGRFDGSTLGTTGFAIFRAEAQVSGAGSGLVGWWKFDEGSGTVAADSSGAGKTGTLSGDLLNVPSWIPGVSGQALLFDTDNDMVQASFPGINTYTYSVLLFPFNTGGTSEQWALSQSVGGNNPCHAFKYTISNKTLTFGSISAALPLGKWSHIMATNDPSANLSTLYVDGVKVGEGAAIVCAQSFNNQVVFGGHPSKVAAQSYRGGLDEVRIYNRVLTEGDRTELSALYAAASASAPIIVSNTSTQILSTNSGTLSVATGGASSCKYSTTPSTAYGSMTEALSSGNGFVHSATVALSFGTNTFYIRCSDTASGVVNSGDFPVSMMMQQACTNTNATEFFVATNGQATNCGTLESPWSLAYAVSGGGGKVKPGATIWLREGIYTGPLGTPISGTAGNPITYRNYNRERARFDGRGVPFSFSIVGNYTRFWGIEVYDSLRGSVTNDISSVWAGASGKGVSYINIISHDGGMGLEGGEIAYGNILYYNGKSPREHAIYWQNDSSVSGVTKVIKDNIIFNPSGLGIHSYSQVGKLKGLLYEGNTVYNAQSGAEIIIGGGTAIDQATLKHNMTYHSPGVCAGCGGGVQLGFYVDNDSVVIEDNYFAENGSGIYFFKPFTSVTMLRNTLIALYYPLNLSLGPSNVFKSGGSHNINNNTYYNLRERNSFVGYANTVNDDCIPTKGSRGDCSVSLAEWSAQTGFDTHSTASTSRPPDKVFVRPNEYESGRANITIYNWSKANSVNVNVSGVLGVGDSYELRSAQDYFGDVTTGTYSGGSISIPMTGRSVATPVSGPAGISTFPEFGAFVIMKISGPVSTLSPPPSVTPPVGSPSPSAIPNNPLPVKSPVPLVGGPLGLALSGNNPSYIKTGTSYLDPGIYVSGSRDFFFKILATVNGKAVGTINDIQLNTALPATYNIVYTVTDSDGKTGTIKRTVVVNRTGIPDPVSPAGVSAASTTTSTASTSSSLAVPNVSSTASSSSKPLLTKNLFPGSKDPQVLLLQSFLVKEKLLPVTAQTGYYGPLTQKAVRSFQSRNSIVKSGTPNTTGYGAVGLKTRALLNKKWGK